jgi:hypothetical protein
VQIRVQVLQKIRAQDIWSLPEVSEFHGLCGFKIKNAALSMPLHLQKKILAIYK